MSDKYTRQYTNEHISDEDSALFRESVGSVKPVKQDLTRSKPAAPKPIPKQLHNDERQAVEDMLSDHYDPAELDTGDEINFQRPGLQHSVIRKLRRGQFSIRAELDLHGMTIAQARPAVAAFLNTAREQRYQCIRIIHGKGLRSSNKGPVLKPMVNKWLSQRDEVLAFCTARPQDGGSGAVYVLLKNK